MFCPSFNFYLCLGHEISLNTEEINKTVHLTLRVKFSCKISKESLFFCISLKPNFVCYHEFCRLILIVNVTGAKLIVRMEVRSIKRPQFNQSKTFLSIISIW